MNILYVCEEYPPGKSGGIGTMVKVLGREFVKQGHNVYVVGLYPHGYSQANYEEDQGVKIWRLRYRTDTVLIKNNFSITDILFLKFLKYSGVLHWDARVSSTALFNFIKNMIGQYHIDIIEMPDWNTFLHNRLTTLSIPVFKVPLVVKLHCSHSYLLNEMNRPLNKRIFEAERHLLQRADRVSAVSLYTASETKKLFGYTKEISILYNCINIPMVYDKKQFGNKVIFTGALTKIKGVHSLLKAWNLVNMQFSSLTLHIYGKGPINDLKKMLTKDASPTVTFHGHVDRETLLEELSTATVAVFPSYSECFSMAPLEAMAAGCAVVFTTKSSGPELITDMENGLLVDPDDINAIANAIILLTENKKLRCTIAGAGKKLVTEKFNISYAVQQHIKFYVSTINEFSERKIQ